MPRKKTETAPVAEAKKKKPSTASKTTRSRESKEKTTAPKKTTAQKKPRTKKDQAPKEQKIEVVEAEVVQEKAQRKRAWEEITIWFHFRNEARKKQGNPGEKVVLHQENQGDIKKASESLGETS